MPYKMGMLYLLLLLSGDSKFLLTNPLIQHKQMLAKGITDFNVADFSGGIPMHTGKLVFALAILPKECWNKCGSLCHKLPAHR